ncbi:MAG TPA: serine/threonine-protein kinase, partial [Isosphaeraceae bacterium]
MRHDTEDQTDRDADLDAILGAYFDAVAAGEEPDRLAWIAGHPKYSAELAAYFVEQDRLHHLTGPLRAAALPPLGCESRVLGGFVLLEELARGGMGVVYKARQVSLNRIVALKLILAGEFAGSADVQRFRAEAEAVAELDHPHIVPIYEVGSHQGRHFFSMKLFEGGSLADCLDRFVADLRAAVRLVASVARAVDHAHRRGILHRDLKPSNILLDEDGEPHVVDFGLARRVGGDGDLTRSGEVLGTPAYMAPEQASGRRGEVTTATDIYGLGAVLYALLTGRAPFACDPAADLLESVRTRPPAPPSSVNRRVDRDLQTICLKCLEKEPAHRYATAEELAEDLDRWLRGEPIAARPVGRTERAWRWARRNPTTAGLGGAVVLLAFAAIVGLAISNALISRERARAEDRSRTARRAVDTMFTRVAEEWLGQQAQLEPLQRDFLLEALSFYQQFAREEGRDPRVQLTT